MFVAVADRSRVPNLAADALQGMQAMGISRTSAADALKVDSTDLLRGHRAVEINHNGAIYRLQTTKLGKLILTK